MRVDGTLTYEHANALPDIFGNPLKVINRFIRFLTTVYFRGFPQNIPVTQKVAGCNFRDVHYSVNRTVSTTFIYYTLPRHGCQVLQSAVCLSVRSHISKAHIKMLQIVPLRPLLKCFDWLTDNAPTSAWILVTSVCSLSTASAVVPCCVDSSFSLPLSCCSSPLVWSSVDVSWSAMLPISDCILMTSACSLLAVSAVSLWRVETSSSLPRCCATSSLILSTLDRSHATSGDTATSDAILGMSGSGFVCIYTWYRPTCLFTRVTLKS